MSDDATMKLNPARKSPSRRKRVDPSRRRRALGALLCAGAGLLATNMFISGNFVQAAPLTSAPSASAAVPEPPSNVVVSTPVNPPTPQNEPTASDPYPDQADPFSATVSWDAPVNGPAPTGYTVTASPQAAQAASAVSPRGGSISAPPIGVQATAQTAAAGGPVLQPAVATTTAATTSTTTPTTTAQPSLVPLTCSVAVDGTTPPSSCEVDGLAPNVPYTFSVAATDSAGASPAAVAPGTVISQTGYTAVVGPARDVVDGQTVNLTVTRTELGLQLSQVYWAWCDGGLSIPPVQDAPAGTNILIGSQSGEFGSSCTDSALSGAAPNGSDVIAAPYNGNKDYPSVSGSVVAQVGSTQQSGTNVTCGPNNPCELGLSVEVPSLTLSTYYNFSVPVTYTTVNALGCTGPANEQLATAGPERLSSWALVNWQRLFCQQAGSGGLDPVDNSDLENESDVLREFSNGSIDIAYTGVSPTTPGFAPSTQRPYVAVPIALDAAVLAVGNGYNEQSSVSRQQILVPWSSAQPPSFTLSELEYLLSACSPSTASPDGAGLVAALQAANPSWLGLSSAVNIAAEPVASGASYGVYGASGSEAMTYLTTSLLHQVLPAHFNTGTWTDSPAGNCSLTSSTGQSNVALNVVSSFATANPQFDVSPYTGYTQLVKDLTPEDLGTVNVYGPAWALTDAATAAETWGGLVDSWLQVPSTVANGPPVYAGPTEASMDAAAAQMVAQPDGTLMPNPDASVAATGPYAGVAPYPLTFVEYAIVPAEPFQNADCSPDTTKQQLLSQWLGYITGAGQAELPPGLQPLPSTLLAQAQAAIAKVGESAVTSGPCAVPVAPTGLQSTAGSTTGSVALTWTAPQGNGGAPVTGYNVVVSALGGASRTIATGSTLTSYTVAGLSPGTYSFSVEALNKAGVGTASSAVTFIVTGATTTTTAGGPTTSSGQGTTRTTTSTSTPGAPVTLPALVTGQDFGTVASGTVQSGGPMTLYSNVDGATANIAVPSGALPDGTTVDLVPVVNPTAFSGFLPGSQSYVVAFAVLWQAPDGASPTAKLPVSLTITDSAISAGDSIYEMTGPKPAEIGTTTEAGTVTVPFEVDPIFIIGSPMATSTTAPPSLLGGGPTTTTAPVGPSTSSSTVASLGTTTSQVVRTTTAGPSSTTTPLSSTTTSAATLGSGGLSTTSTTAATVTSTSALAASSTTSTSLAALGTTTTQAGTMGPATSTTALAPSTTSPSGVGPVPATAVAATTVPATTVPATTLPGAPAPATTAPTVEATTQPSTVVTAQTTPEPTTQPTSPTNQTTTTRAQIVLAAVPPFGGSQGFGWTVPASSVLVVVLALAGVSFLTGRTPSRRPTGAAK